MLNEDRIIDLLKMNFSKYIGDDAAIIPVGNKQSYVITKDLLIEDVHFRTSYCDPKSLAHKALHVNLSDIAAMCGNPIFILGGISIPALKEKYAIEFLKNFVDVCKAQSVELIGGDTTKSPDKLFISITAIGLAQDDNIKYRNKAKLGDLIYYAGNLGYAQLGFRMLESGHDGAEIFKEAFLRPNALVKEGLWLGQKYDVHAVMDVSDGLFVDLQKLCKASGFSAEINLDNFRLSEEFILECANLGMNAIDVMLTGGEDYGLLFTADSVQCKSSIDEFKVIFGYEPQYVGRITSNTDELTFMKDGVKKELSPKPFSHFGEL